MSGFWWSLKADWMFEGSAGCGRLELGWKMGRTPVGNDGGGVTWRSILKT